MSKFRKYYADVNLNKLILLDNPLHSLIIPHRGYDIDIKNFYEILLVINTYTTIEYIDLSGHQFSNDVCQVLYNAYVFNLLGNVKHFNLSDMGITSKGIKLLSKIKCIESLYLYDTTISNDDIELLKKSIVDIQLFL